jgi:ATP-dependent protease ClpP protease subunit
MAGTVMGYVWIDGALPGEIFDDGCVPILTGNGALQGRVALFERAGQVAAAFIVEQQDVTADLGACAYRGDLSARAELVERRGLTRLEAMTLTRAPGVGTAWPGSLPRENLPDDLRAMWQPTLLALIGLRGKPGQKPPARPSGAGIQHLELRGEIAPAMASRFARQVTFAAGKSIHLNIDSCGGQVRAALDICCALSEHDHKVTATILGEASSSAALVALAADARRIDRGGTMLLHRPVPLEAEPHLDDVVIRKAVASIETKMAHLMAERTGRSLALMRRWMAREAKFNATDALQAGLVHAIVDAPQWLEAA